ncbi:MAG: hypothetical protein ACFE0Q_13930 [Anaerolineae bacterium]
MKRIYIPVLVLTSLIFLSACIADATLTCTSFSASVDYQYETDNTGSASQTYYLRVLQGDGRVLYNRFVVEVSAGTNTIDVNGTFTRPALNPLLLQLYSPAGGDLPTTRVYDTVTFNCDDLDSAPRVAFYDGRLNDYDTGNPVVLYPYADSEDNRGLDIYSASGEGLLHRIPAEAFARVGRCPSENTTIFQSEETGIIISALAGEYPDGVCPYQLNAPTGEPGKVYVMIFDHLHPDTYYESYEVFLN